MIPAWKAVVRQKQINRNRRGRKANQTITSSNAKMRTTVKAWNPCGRRCWTYQPSHVGSGPFS